MSQGSGGPDSRRWLALALLGTAFFMVILDGTIVLTALPVIGRELGLATGAMESTLSGRSRGVIASKTRPTRTLMKKSASVIGPPISRDEAFAIEERAAT